MKNVSLKILKVMEAVKSVAKDGFNSFHKYKYVTDASIVVEIRKQLIKNNLICIPTQESCTLVGDLTTLLVKYTLIDIDSGETLITQVYGYGQDKGDKGIYKAATGAEKYFLLKTFLLPTDDDPENEREPKKRVTKEELATFEASMPPKTDSQFIGHNEALSLFTLIGQDKAFQNAFKEHLKTLGIEGTNKIPKIRYTEFYEWIIRQKEPQVGA